MDTNIVELAKRMQENDENAFREFFDIYFDKLYRFLLTILRNSEDSEDVTSTAFIYVWNNRAQLRQPDQLVAWLYQIGRHRAFDHIRREKNRRFVSVEEIEEFLPDGRVNIEDDADKYFSKKFLDKFLEGLSLEDRALIHLRFAEDLPFDQIGKILEASPIAVRVRFHRVVKKLQRKADDGTFGHLRPSPATKELYD